jgi:hypothetical protein
MPIAMPLPPRFGPRRRLSEREVEALLSTLLAGLVLAGMTSMAHSACPMSHCRGSGTSRVDIAKLTLKKYADEAFPQWTRYHGGRCPPDLQALNEYMHNKDIRDPWDEDYRMRCGDGLPEGARGIAVWSRGEDGLDGTNDDIRSWE